MKIMIIPVVYITLSVLSSGGNSRASRLVWAFLHVGLIYIPLDFRRPSSQVLSNIHFAR